MPSSNAKYVFICGLHRSGTTALAQDIGRLNGCTGFGSTGAGILLDEGQHLQDVYPPDTAYHGVGRFGFAPQAHLTEESPLLTSANVSRLTASWEIHWDRNKAVRVEKTPSNLLRTRFLQAAFPAAHFIVIRRHPVAVSLASQKWSRTPLHSLFEHWLRCNAIYDEDRKHLQRVHELSYEDYVSDRSKHLKAIGDFIGAEMSDPVQDERSDVHNRKYFDRWAWLLQSSPLRPYYRSLVEAYDARFRERGYSLLTAAVPMHLSTSESRRARGIANPLLYLTAEAYGVLWRSAFEVRTRTERFTRRHWPGLRASVGSLPDGC